MWKLTGWLPLLFVSVLVGCGGSNDLPELGRVSGTIKIDGQPTPNVAVRFTPADGGRPSTGTTDDQGFYQLVYSTTELGAKTGPHKVSIVVQSQPDAEIDAQAMARPADDGIAGKYADVTKEVEVKAGDNTIDLEYP